jgi:hypothetical protein
MALRFKLPVSTAVSGGWNGEIGRVVEILAAGSADLTIAARPVMRLIVLACLADRLFMKAVAANDRKAAAKRLRALAMKVIKPGVKPINKPSTARGKGGDTRALRDPTGRDRIYREFKTDPATE